MITCVAHDAVPLEPNIVSFSCVQPSLLPPGQHPGDQPLQRSQRLHTCMLLSSTASTHICCCFMPIKSPFSYWYLPLQIFEPKGVKIFKIPSPLFFANIEFFKEKLREAVRKARIISQLCCTWAFSLNKANSNAWLFQVGFNPLKILKKRNKALRKVKNLAKKSNFDITEVRCYTTRLPSVLGLHKWAYLYIF